MAPARRRPDPQRAPIPVEIQPVPKTGHITVLFLGPYLGMLTHWQGGRGRACPGLSTCPPTIHRCTSVWKGYAPVEIWRPAPHGDWAPGVFEVTERAAELLDQAGELPGQVWKFYRVLGRYSHVEIAGAQLETRDVAGLRADVRVEPVVERLYRTNQILWGVARLFEPRPMLLASASPPPDDPDSRADNEKPMTLDEWNKFRQKMGLPPQTEQDRARRGNND